MFLFYVHSYAPNIAELFPFLYPESYCIYIYPPLYKCTLFLQLEIKNVFLYGTISWILTISFCFKY